MSEQRQKSDLQQVLESMTDLLKQHQEHITQLEAINLLLYKYLREVLQNAKFFSMAKQNNILVDFEKEIQKFIDQSEVASFADKETKKRRKIK
jgi:hypothetical protein